jgi:ATP-dependent DNA ligase
MASADEERAAVDDALLQRIHPAQSRVRRLARETPVTYLLFDALVDDQGRDLTALPLAERRERLERVFAQWPAGERLRLSPATPDRALAARWLAELGGAGLDGVVAKRAETRMRQGSARRCAR